jgi:hypothetical protein
MRKSEEFEVWRSAGSCCIRRPDPSDNLGALFPHDHANVVLTLQPVGWVEPFAKPIIFANPRLMGIAFEECR